MLKCSIFCIGFDFDGNIFLEKSSNLKASNFILKKSTIKRSVHGVVYDKPIECFSLKIEAEFLSYENRKFDPAKVYDLFLVEQEFAIGFIRCNSDLVGVFSECCSKIYRKEFLIFQGKKVADFSASLELLREISAAGMSLEVIRQ